MNIGFGCVVCVGVVVVGLPSGVVVYGSVSDGVGGARAWARVRAWLTRKRGNPIDNSKGAKL